MSLKMRKVANIYFSSLDFVGTVLSVFFNYLGPFFLKRIIDAIDSRVPAIRARAYLFAVLMFAAQVLKSQADLQHLWYGRRASVRIRSQLMAAIYEKALKRKDLSGIVKKEEEKKESSEDKKSKKEKKSSKNKKDSGDDQKAGADIGKIVNLMAGDAQRIAMVGDSSSILIFIANVVLTCICFPFADYLRLLLYIWCTFRDRYCVAVSLSASWLVCVRRFRRPYSHLAAQQFPCSSCDSDPKGCSGCAG